MTATNHLANSSNTAEALQSFTDEQLVEQSAWLNAERQRLLAEPNDGKPYGNHYAAYRMSVTDSAIYAEWHRRHDELPFGDLIQA